MLIKKSNYLKVLTLILVFTILTASPVGILPVQAADAAFNISSPNTSTFYGTWQGFGAEWDPFFWNTNNQNRGCNQADWNLITSRIQQLGLSITRMMMHWVKKY
jgi:hypothetical protein